MEDNIQWEECAIGAFANVSGMFRSFQVSTKVRDDNCVQPGRAGFVGKKVDGAEYHVFSDIWLWIPRPVKWNGEGLPPVGAELECGFACEGFKAWHKGVCVAIGIDPEDREEICVVKSGEKIAMYTTYGGRMRPIRTAEQIAAEERNERIAAMCKLVQAHPTYPVHNLDISHSAAMRLTVEALHDAGYRRVEGGAQ
ncbi:hypothetical protein FHR70_000710 [Microvirga lupini]|uniref:Uncharacterized protein n=1 Tax=Microvirga lupini TaxID=420324 RepID=A0A7W4VJ11_9HYPH|nr:hypothetical protein [Microvirga lupini]MBB3017670.1 hypothetical protein [Microvirga lupini]